MLFHSTCTVIQNGPHRFATKTARKRCCIQVFFHFRLCSEKFGTRLEKHLDLDRGFLDSIPKFISRDILALGGCVAYKYVLKILQRLEGTSDAEPISNSTPKLVGYSIDYRETSYGRGRSYGNRLAAGRSSEPHELGAKLKIMCENGPIRRYRFRCERRTDRSSVYTKMPS